MKRLTDRQQRFLDAYAGNATEAARAAGYAGDEQTLATTGSRLLRNAQIRAHLDARRGLASKGLIAEREEVEAFLTARLRDGKNPALAVKAAQALAKMKGWNLQRVELAGRVSLEQLLAQAEAKPERPPEPPKAEMQVWEGT